MRGILTILLLGILLISTVSAEIIINQQPKDSYNLGDTIKIPVTIKTITPVSGTFQMDLLCNGHQINFYKNGVGLDAGEEQKMEPSLVLTGEVIGEIKGECVIKSILAGEYVLSREFKIQNTLTLGITSDQVEFEPGTSILIQGDAIKANGKDVEGFVDFEIISGNGTVGIMHTESINRGFFLANISIPKEMKAGVHLVKINAYEKDNLGAITNQGFLTHNIIISQISTSLEIVFETSEAEPGVSLMVKAILHDQTGEKIENTVIITIKDSKDKILEQTEIPTDQFLEFPVPHNQPAGDLQVIAVSNFITSESDITVPEKTDISIELINKTLILKNTGNVLYSDNVLIKIGEEVLNVNATLDIDEEQKYILSAPDGQYTVEIMGISKDVMLTGKVVNVKKASGGVISLIRYPFVWIFIMVVLGFVGFMVVRKGYKRSFIGRVIKRKKKSPHEGDMALTKKSLITTHHKAELSLSIKGEKQSVSIVSLKIKNLGELESKKGNAEETLQKIVDMAGGEKAYVYENQSNIFFILAPATTKTFKNEKTALDIAQKAEEVLNHHNKLFNQKINFGISLNYGAIIAKLDKGILRFMSLGTLITSAKKTSSLAHNEVLLGEKIRERLSKEVRTEKHKKDGVEVYSIKEVRTHPKDHEKFIKQFLSSIEKDKREKEKRRKEGKK